MNSAKRGICGLVVLAVIVAFGVNARVARAVIDTSELPGNLFHQYVDPVTPNVGIAVNNPQNMAGGQWVGGSTANYPIGGSSPILDGVANPSSTWYTGGFDSSNDPSGGMLNFAFTQGSYSADTSTFTNSPFGHIGLIRIWAYQYINDDSSVWEAFPDKVKIAYTTASFNPGSGYSYNSGTIGVLPGTWNTDAAITEVDGNPATDFSNGGDYDGLGWTDLTGLFATNSLVVNSHITEGYVDLYVTIPAGATSILISFGQDNGTPNPPDGDIPDRLYSPGGLAIEDVQALVPEPASFAMLGIGAGLMLGRRRTA